MTTFRIALANLPFPSSPGESVSLAVEAIARAGEARAGLVCFPECYVPGYRATGKAVPPYDLIDLSAAWAQHAHPGAVSNSLWLVLGCQVFYVVDYFVLEEAILSTWDIQHEGFGFMLGWGCLVWIPFTFSLQAVYLANRPVDLPAWAVVGIAVVVAPRLPDGLRRWSSHDDRLILEALWQVFEETAHQRLDRLPRAAPEFFELMRLIYAASHDSALTPLDQASLPHASLYLLKRYLQMHPTLRADVQSALKRGASMIRWNPTMVLHRMQVAFDAFLAYHGWQAEGPLQVRATMTNWEDREPRVFSVEVWLDSGELLMTERNGVVPGRDEIDRAAKAIAWVLYALVAHASRLGLDTPAFW